MQSSSHSRSIWSLHLAIASSTRRLLAVDVEIPPRVGDDAEHADLALHVVGPCRLGGLELADDGRIALAGEVHAVATEELPRDAEQFGLVRHVEPHAHGTPAAGFVEHRLDVAGDQRIRQRRAELLRADLVLGHGGDLPGRRLGEGRAGLAQVADRVLQRIVGHRDRERRCRRRSVVDRGGDLVLTIAALLERQSQVRVLHRPHWSRTVVASAAAVGTPGAGSVTICATLPPWIGTCSACSSASMPTARRSNLPLQGCRNDMRHLEQYLRGRLGDAAHIVTLADGQATREGVVAGFRSHLAQAGDGDIALFAYSGHGSQEAAAHRVRVRRCVGQAPEPAAVRRRARERRAVRLAARRQGTGPAARRGR